MLNKTKHFKNIVSHFDIAPSILAYYRDNYKISTPSTVSWIGKGLWDKPRLDLKIPLMQSKNQLIDYVYGKYHLQDNNLLLLKNLEEDILKDEAAFKKVDESFKQYKSTNAQFYSSKKVMPDSVVVNFLKKTHPKF